MGEGDLVSNPVRDGRHVRARPILPADYGWVYEVAVLTDTGSHWRLHGQTPPYEAFASTVLFENAAATYLLERRSTGERMGLVQLVNHHAGARNGFLTAFLVPEYRALGWPMEGIVLFADFVFSAYNLEKLYLESLSDEAARYRSLVGRFLVEEGRLRSHRLVHGRWMDAHLFALYRPAMAELSAAFLPDAARCVTRAGDDG